MEKELITDVFNIFQKRYRAENGSVDGPYIELNEPKELLPATRIGHLGISIESLRTAVKALVKSEQILLAPGYSGFPDYDIGGPNEHYRFHILSDPNQIVSKITHVIINNTPPNKSWASLRIQFIDGRTLHASIPGTSWARNGISSNELGLEKKVGGKIKTQWILLQEMAREQGRLNLSVDAKAKESKRKQLNLLKTHLKSVFPELVGEPFQILDENIYQATFELVPEQREEDF